MSHAGKPSFTHGCLLSFIAANVHCDSAKQSHSPAQPYTIEEVFIEIPLTRARYGIWADVSRSPSRRAYVNARETLASNPCEEKGALLSLELGSGHNTVLGI